FAERTRALDNDTVEQLAGYASGSISWRLSSLDSGAYGCLLRRETLLLLLEVIADARHLHAKLQVVAEVRRVGELRRGVSVNEQRRDIGGALALGCLRGALLDVLEYARAVLVGG